MTTDQATQNPEDLSLMDLQAESDSLRKRINRFRESLGRFFVNKQELIDLMCVAAISQEPLLLIGPPGTGKSFTIAQLILDAVARGQTVLLSSKMNKAVDVVVEKLTPHLGV